MPTLQEYKCPCCGGEIVGDANTAASSCPFCGNPVVMMRQFSGALRPDFVTPFKPDKKAAKAGLQKHLTGKRLLPKVFRNQNHIDEIQGRTRSVLAVRHRRDSRAQQHQILRRQSEVCALPRAASEHHLERKQIQLYHERTERKVCRRSPGG